VAKLNDEDRENLVAYFDGELDETAARTLEAKLNLDPETRAEADALQAAWSLLDYLPRSEPSPSFTHRTLEKLALQTSPLRRPQGPRWWTVLGWAAAILLAAGVGFAAARWLWQPRTPPDLDDQLIRHFRVIDKVHQYDQVDDVDFLHALDHPDLFGEEPGS
jgi:ferric-dicitrate binding protein FerR (iron transport regulator)